MKRNISLAILTESSNKIGTGHLIESLNLAGLAGKKGFNISFWVSRDSPKSVLKRIPFAYNQFSSLKEAKDILRRISCDAAVFNFRRIDNNVLRSFRKNGLKTLCIDELGGRRLDCDAIVNPLIVDKYYQYPSRESYSRLYMGTDYLSMSSEFRKNRGRKNFSGKIKEVTVSMGGVDNSGTTLNLIDIMAEWRKEAIKNIIIGGGFRFSEEVRSKILSLKGMNFKIYHNIENIARLFTKSDVVFTAGGNTLYELACLGIPAIVLYEDEHERENGAAFQKLGFGICLGRGTATPTKKILAALGKFDDPTLRKRHSARGMHVVDGNGADRILKILEGLTKND